MIHLSNRFVTKIRPIKATNRYIKSYRRPPMVLSSFNNFFKHSYVDKSIKFCLQCVPQRLIVQMTIFKHKPSKFLIFWPSSQVPTNTGLICVKNPKPNISCLVLGMSGKLCKIMHPCILFHHGVDAIPQSHHAQLVLMGWFLCRGCVL